MLFQRNMSNGRIHVQDRLGGDAMLAKQPLSGQDITCDVSSYFGKVKHSRTLSRCSLRYFSQTETHEGLLTH